MPRLTYANVMSTIAVFIALGGTSYAVTKLPKNSVTSRHVKDGSLQAVDLAAGLLMAGPRGPRGSEGPAGPQGPQGPPGVAGQVEPFNAIPLASGWTAYGGDFAPGRFRKDASGRVTLSGLIRKASGTAPKQDDVIGTLPPGYRPSRRLMFDANMNNTFGRVDIKRNGSILWMTGTGTWVNLDSITFWTD